MTTVSIGIAAEKDTTLPVTPAKSAIARTRVKLPPGFYLRRFSAFLFSGKTFEREFAPTLADLELEYIEALAVGSKIKATYVYWRGVASFWMTLGLYLCGSILGKVVKAFWMGS